LFVLLVIVLLSSFSFFRFGGTPDSYPHPREDFYDFKQMLTTQMDKTGKVFNPITKQMSNYIHLKKVKSMAGHGGCTIS
jgi:hypothetical protein